MEELVKVYAEIAKALGYDVDLTTGDIFDSIGGEVERPKTVDDIPIVLPVGEHLKNITGVNDSGQIVKTRCIFNPFKENAVADTDSLTWLRTQVIVNLNSYIYTSVKYLMSLLSKKENKLDLGDYATGFLLEAGPKLKKKLTVDELTFKIWKDIGANSLDGTSDPLSSLTTYRKTKINEGNFTAWAKFNPDIIDKINHQLETGNSSTYRIDGVKVNRNNLEIYKLCLDYILNTGKVSYPYVCETEVLDAPVTTALLELYNNITKIPFNIIKDLEYLNVSEADWIPLLHEKRNTLISRSSIDSIPMLIKVAEGVLDGNDATPNNKPTKVKPAPIDTNTGKVVNPVQVMQPVQNQPQPPIPVQQPVQPMVQSNTPESDTDKLKRQFGINGSGYGLMAAPRVVAPQPQPVQPPVYAQPVPMVQPLLMPQQQPMFQQPVPMQQPMMMPQQQYQVMPMMPQYQPQGNYQPMPRYVNPNQGQQSIRGNALYSPLA